MSNIGALVVSLEANIAKFESDMAKAAAEAEKRAQQIDKSFGIVKKSLASSGRMGKLHLDTADSHLDGIRKTELHSGKAQFIVLDGPRRIAELTRAVVLLADLVLVPAGASIADLWATGDVLAMVTEAKAVKRIKARLVWTRHRGFTNQAKALTEQAKAELGIKPLDTAMSLRVAYVDALGAGLTAAESADAQAKAEVQTLIAEVYAILA